MLRSMPLPPGSAGGGAHFFGGLVDDLAQWLGAQLDEDERTARARRGIFPSPGVDEDGTVWLHIRPGGNAVIVRQHDPIEGYDDLAKLRDWADADDGWTLARVLREIDAKRQILRQAFQHAATIDGEWGCCHDAEAIKAGYCEEQQPSNLPLLRLLALPYADRPGYREEWRP